jgi:hypothetical protein
MAIMFEPKGGRKNTEVSSAPDVLPLGQKPEGEIDVIDKLEKAKNKLFASIDILQENIIKLKDENKRLKDALGITEVEEPMNAEAAHGLVLTKDMEVTDGSK